MDRKKIPFESGQPDGKVTQLLRGAFAAPVDPAYWDGLEGRIMSRIAQHGEVLQRVPASWWSVLERWTMPGLAAAGLLFALAGLAWSREQASELRTTYEAFAEPVDSEMLPGAVNVVTSSRDGTARREAVFRYVLSH
ncbi:MAG TPA: hypothetical protein VNJ04_11325 [Gemmatimonadaceae bacterium]|nr:hypothetical protein [Gemmatimonadaceae bacterium]